MLLPGGLSSFSFTYDNWGANPSSTFGTSVVPGASNAEGSWTEVASSANIAANCYWLTFRVYGGATASNIKSHLLDIGVDPAGGTSYTAVISNLVVGASSGIAGNGNREFLFPLFIKAGSSVAVRIQGSNATAGTVYVPMTFFGSPSHPEVVPVGMFSESLGTITNSNGQSLTPGDAADGSWIDLGATSKAMWWWQLGYQINNGTITADYTYIEVAFGDASNKISIFKIFHIGTAAADSCGVAAQNNMLACAAYKPVPAGAHIYVRGRCNSAPDTGYNVNVVGIGG